MGNSLIAKQFKQQGIQLEYVIDEGGTVVDGVMPGISQLVALVGTSGTINWSLILIYYKKRDIIPLN
jgi:carboxypeptidase PM20D1